MNIENKKEFLPEIQKRIEKYINQYEEGYWPPLAMFGALTEEIGEIARIILANEKIKPLKPNEQKNSLENELGDVLFALGCIANFYGINLTKAFENTMKKYEKRDKNRWTAKK